jgi:hypothetical protein
MSDQELRSVVASLGVAQQQTDRQLKENAQQLKELGEYIRELGTQIGGLGNKFGSFAEGMAMPSLEEIMRREFGVAQFLEMRGFKKGADEMELELIGLRNGGSPAVVAAEVKSALNRRELQQFLKNLGRFFEFLPQFRGHKLYGIVAAVDASADVESEALRNGVYVARMSNEVFELKKPESFVPRDFAEGAASAPSV